MFEFIQAIKVIKFRFVLIPFAKIVMILKGVEYTQYYVFGVRVMKIHQA